MYEHSPLPAGGLHSLRNRNQMTVYLIHMPQNHTRLRVNYSLLHALVYSNTLVT